MTDEAVTDPPADPAVDPASSPPDPAPDPATIADDPGAVDSDVPASWREDWRDALAGSNKDDLKTLNRFKTPDGVWKAYNSLRQKVSNGEYQRTRPNTEDAEALKAWRAEAGLPETPEGYLEKLPEGLEVPAEDQPFVDRYLERMHAEGASSKHVHDGLAWYYETQQQAAEERAEADKNLRARSEDDLRSEWGPEYRGNINGMRAMLESFAPEGLKEELFTARTDDGTLLGDHPGFLKMLVGIANEINPNGIITPSVGEDRMANIDTRISEIENLMGDTKSRNDPNGYWSNPAMQEEYRRLLDLKERHRAA